MLAGLALSPTPAGVPLVLAGTGMFIAIDAVGCIEGSGVSCGFLIADVVTAGATAYGRPAASVGRFGREPWEEMLQQTSVWGTRAAASRPAAGVLAGLSAGVTAIGDYGEGFGGP